MGTCCNINKGSVSKNNIITKSNMIKDNNAFSKRMSRFFDKNDIATKRNSIFAYNNENIKDVYVFKSELGSGYFGKVQLAHFPDEPNKFYAVKSIDKTRLSNTQIETLSREIDILSTVDHPNIIRYYETYTDDKFFHIVMEYLSGGDLLSGLSKKKYDIISEKKICSIINKLLSAISHIHSLGIVHRDLKPDNILFEKEDITSDIKIIDFGVSRQSYTKNDDLTSIVGTPYYVAPEVLSGKYDKKVDVWSIGIIMYVLLTGRPPFNGSSKSELFEKIKTKDIPYPVNHRILKRKKTNLKDEENKLIDKTAEYSKECVSFLNSLTYKDPQKRPTAIEALKNKWFNILKDEDCYCIPIEVLKNLRSFRLPNLFQRVIIKFIVKQLNSDKIIELKRAFVTLDKENTGYIDPIKLEEAFTSNFPDFSKHEMTTIIDNCNLNYGNSKRINYTSFIASALDKNILFSDELLKQTFKHLDTYETNYLTIDSIIKAFERTGKIKKQEVITSIFKEIGLSSENKIDYDKFKSLMLKNTHYNKSIEKQATAISIIENKKIISENRSSLNTFQKESNNNIFSYINNINLERNAYIDMKHPNEIENGIHKVTR